MHDRIINPNRYEKDSVSSASLSDDRLAFRSGGSAFPLSGRNSGGFGAGVGSNPFLRQNRVTVDMVNGIRVNSYFSIGLGLGYHTYLGRTIEGIDFTDEHIVPVYANLKGYMPAGRSMFRGFVSAGRGLRVLDGVRYRRFPDHAGTGSLHRTKCHFFGRLSVAKHFFRGTVRVFRRRIDAHRRDVLTFFRPGRLWSLSGSFRSCGGG